MSKPSTRKQKKQKERERRVGEKKLRIADHKLYAENFPEFVFQTNNAPAEFVDLIRRTVRGIDFRDRSMFVTQETNFLKQLKRRPEIVTPLLRQGVAQLNLTALHFATMIGHRVFARIPADELRKWIPFHDVQFFMTGTKIVVFFRSLEQVRGNGGTLYFSPRRPTLEINGQKLIVGWSRHAIERTCERLAPRWDSYLGLGDVFAFFHDCQRFDLCQLHGGRQLGFTFFDECEDGFFNGLIAEEVLGRKPNGKSYYRVGYCPVAIESGFAKATTLLFPGYTGTPEYGLILRHGLNGRDRTELVDAAGRLTRAELENSRDFSLMKMFHRNGVPQVIETDEEFFSAV